MLTLIDMLEVQLFLNSLTLGQEGKDFKEPSH